MKFKCNINSNDTQMKWNWLLEFRLHFNNEVRVLKRKGRRNIIERETTIENYWRDQRRITYQFMMRGSVEDESKSQRNFRKWCESDQVRARETFRSIVRAVEWEPKKHGGIGREKENSDFESDTTRDKHSSDVFVYQIKLNGVFLFYFV